MGLMTLWNGLNVLGKAVGIGSQVINAGSQLAGMFGGWGQTGHTQSMGGSTQQGEGHSQSMSKSGSNDQQVMEYLKGAYQYQGAEGARQSQFNQRSMLEQMGYNTLGAIMQGVYNHIENAQAMNFNSTEAMKNREWQEHMSNTAYQRAVEDMKKAGLNPILAFQNGGASTPGGSAGTISGASMGAPSSSALGVSRASGFVPNSYTSESWSQSDWYNAAKSWNQMLASTGMSPYGMMKAFEGINKGIDKVMNENVPKNAGDGAGRMKPGASRGVGRNKQNAGGGAGRMKPGASRGVGRNKQSAGGGAGRRK